MAGLLTVGFEGAFFSAAGDDAALQAERRVGGPLGRPRVTGRRRTGLLRTTPVVTELGPAFDGVDARGYDGAVHMASLEQLLTGRDAETVTAQPRWAGSPGTGDEPLEDCGVITLTDSLRDALADADDLRLGGVVGPWTRTEELQQAGWQDVTTDEHLQFLRDLRDLARRARHAGHRLYWYFSV